MVAPRKITIEYLNSLLTNSPYKVVGREDNPNHCQIQFDSCGHTKTVAIASVGSKQSYCDVCFEYNLRILLKEKGFDLLAKLKYGEAKSSYEYRLCRCINCGNFVFTLPNQIYGKGRIECSICNFNLYKNLAKSRGYELINRVNKDSLLLRCSCGNEFTYQGSNLKHATPKCTCCGRKDNGSYCYLFKIENCFGDFIKIGKSNNPYLRHLRFSEDDLNTYVFLGAKKFVSEIDALKFEKYMLNKYKSFNLYPEFSKLFISNGFTEIFSYEILKFVLEDIKN